MKKLLLTHFKIQEILYYLLLLKCYIIKYSKKFSHASSFREIDLILESYYQISREALTVVHLANVKPRLADFARIS